MRASPQERPDRRSMRWRFALLSAVLIAASAAAPVSAQLEPAPDDPALFDLDLAQRQLAEIDREIERLEGEIAEALDEVDGLVSNRDFLAMNEVARADTLQLARSEARRLSVRAYIGLGPPISGLRVLDAADATELSFRNALLRQQAERLHDAARNYEILAGDANDEVLELSESIDDARTVVERLSRDLARAKRPREHAEWTVSIAEIHAIADEEMRTRQRPEPTAEQWRELRFCESTETYGIDNGNSFYGAYQFTWETWMTVGGNDENPALTPPAEQDARARLLYSRRGSQPWPICGRYLP